MPQLCVENIIATEDPQKKKKILGHSIFFVLHLFTFGMNDVAKKKSVLTALNFLYHPRNI